MRLFKTVRPYDQAERWYGLCWHNYADRTIATAVIPLNLPIRLGYLIWIWLKVPFLNWEPKR